MTIGMVSRLFGASFVMVLMVSLVFTAPALAQETVPPEEPPAEQPREQNDHHVDALMMELNENVELREDQEAQVRSLLEAEVATAPQTDEYAWSPDNHEFNQQVEEVLDEEQATQFRTWLWQQDDEEFGQQDVDTDTDY